MGAGMALGLHDSAFGTLAGLYGRGARGAITGIRPRLVDGPALVSASDGKLDIQTNPGQGTTVRLIFPRAESE